MISVAITQWPTSESSIQQFSINLWMQRLILMIVKCFSPLPLCVQRHRSLSLSPSAASNHWQWLLPQSIAHIRSHSMKPSLLGNRSPLKLYHQTYLSISDKVNNKIQPACSWADTLSESWGDMLFSVSHCSHMWFLPWTTARPSSPCFMRATCDLLFQDSHLVFLSSLPPFRRMMVRNHGNQLQPAMIGA